MESCVFFLMLIFWEVDAIRCHLKDIKKELKKRGE